MAKIYINVADKILEKIDKARKTEKGEIPRSEFIEKLLEKALEVIANG